MEAKHGFQKARPDPIQHAFVKKLPKMQYKLCAQEGHTLFRAQRDNLLSQKYPIITGHWPSHHQAMAFPLDLMMSKSALE